MNTQDTQKSLYKMRKSRINGVYMSAICVEVDLRPIPEEALEVLREEARRRRVPLGQVIADAARLAAEGIIKSKEGKE